MIQLWDWLAVSSPLAKNQPDTVQIGGEIQAAFILWWLYTSPFKIGLGLIMFMIQAYFLKDLYEVIGL